MQARRCLWLSVPIANLVVFPVMLVLAYAAARGSARAFLAWVGTLAYSAYTYAIYSFAGPELPRR